LLKARSILSYRPRLKTTPNHYNYTFPKNTGNLRPPAVQSVQECCARLHTPTVASPVQKPPLSIKIRPFIKVLVFYVLRPCSRCRGDAQGYSSSVTVPIQKPPLTIKITHFEKILVVYVLPPCSRCRGVAPGYMHPQLPPPFKNHPYPLKLDLS